MSLPSFTTSTFTIVASDGRDWCVAVASRVLAVGAIVGAAAAGRGAVATQATVNVAWKEEGLAMLRERASADQVVRELAAADDHPDVRQLLVVDAAGGAAAHTGENCGDWAGHRTEDGFVAGGNIINGPDVLEAMVAAYRDSKREIAERCLAALAAGDRAGGDRRGRQSAALLVVRAGAGIDGGDDRLHDLRVDDHAQPVPELRRLFELARTEL